MRYWPGELYADYLEVAPCPASDSAPLGVAAGPEKLQAIRGALTGKLVNVLVGDEDPARALLERGLKEDAMSRCLVGRDVKGKISPVAYAVAIPLAFAERWISGAITTSR